MGATILALAIWLLVSAWGILETTAGRARLLEWVNGRMAAGGARVRIEGWGPGFPQTISLARIELADKEGVWLEIGEVRIDLAFRDLLDRQLSIRRLSVGHIVWHRKPNVAEREPRDSSPPQGFSIPWPVCVDRVEIGRADLPAEAMGGEPLRAAIAGRVFSWPGRGVVARLDVDANEGEGRAGLRAWMCPETLFARVALHGEAEEGGVFARLARLPDASGFGVRLAAAGSFEKIDGRAYATSSVGEGEVEFGVWPGDETRLEVDACVSNVSWEAVEFERARISAAARVGPTGVVGSASGDVRVRGYEVTASVGGVARPGFFSIEHLAFAGSGVTVTGAVDVSTSNRSIRGDLIVEVEDLAPFSPLIGTQVSGRVSARAHLREEGTGQACDAWARAVDVRTPWGDCEGLDLRVSSTNVFEDPDGAVWVHATGVGRDALLVSSLIVEARGGLESFAFSVAATGAFEQAFGFDTAGSAALSNGVALRIERFRAEAMEVRFELRDALSVNVASNGWAVSGLRACLAGGMVTAQAESVGDRIDARGSYSNVPLSVLGALGGPDLKGTASVSVAVSGTLADPSIEARASVEGFGIVSRKRPGLATLDAQAWAVAGNGLFAVGVDAVGAAGTRIGGSATGRVAIALQPFSVTWDRTAPLDGRVEIGADLEHISNLLDLEDQILAGRIVGNLDATGTLDEPDLDGALTLTNGLYQNLALGVVLKDMDVRLRGDRSRLVIERAVAGDGDAGTIRLLGDVCFGRTNSPILDVSLGLENAELLRSDNMEVKLDGGATLRGGLDGLTCTGTFTVLKAFFRIPAAMPPNVVNLAVIRINDPDEAIDDAEEEDPASATGSFGERIALDVTIVAPGRVSVSGRGLDSEWSGRLRATGTLASPSLAGNLSVVRGTMNFLGKRLNLAESAIAFDGSAPPDPILNIVARSRGGGLDARLRVQGPATSPELSVESDPPLPQDEVLARLLFGRSGDRVTPLQALNIAYGISMLQGGESTFDLMGRAQALLGFDDIQLQQDPDNEDRTELVVGKYVSERVYVQAGKALSGPDGGVTVEFFVTPSVSLVTTTRTGDREGIYLKWNVDY